MSERQELMDHITNWHGIKARSSGISYWIARHRHKHFDNLGEPHSHAAYDGSDHVVTERNWPDPEVVRVGVPIKPIL